MEELVPRIRRLCGGCPLRDISDALLLALLAQSEYVPDTVQSGIILFERGEPITYWYLLLSGEVELYLPPPSFAGKAAERRNGTSRSRNRSGAAAFANGGVPIRLRTLTAGAIFGELNLSCHSCSARVRQCAEFVRIPQTHFLQLYNKHADHLQPFIHVMEDFVVAADPANIGATNTIVGGHQTYNGRTSAVDHHQPPWQKAPTKQWKAATQRDAYDDSDGNAAYNFSGMRDRLASSVNGNAMTDNGLMMRRKGGAGCRQRQRSKHSRAKGLFAGRYSAVAMDEENDDDDYEDGDDDDADDYDDDDEEVWRTTASVTAANHRPRTILPNENVPAAIVWRHPVERPDAYGGPVPTRRSPALEPILRQPQTAELSLAPNAAVAGCVEANLFELNGIVSLDSRVRHAALALKRTMQLRSPWMIADRQLYAMDSCERYSSTMIGAEMVQWLAALCRECFRNAGATSGGGVDGGRRWMRHATDGGGGAPSTSSGDVFQFTPIQMVGVWQALLDAQHICHVKHEIHFANLPNAFYRWNVADAAEHLYAARAQFYRNMMPSPGNFSASAMDGSIPLVPLSLPPTTGNAATLARLSGSLEEEEEEEEETDDSGAEANDNYADGNYPGWVADAMGRGAKNSSSGGGGGASPPTASEVQSALFLLSSLGPDALLRVILGKSPAERTPEELELVYNELLHVKALSHLSKMVKRELARVIRHEQHQHAGTVLFHQGEPGDSWYIIWRSGSVDVSILGKGVVCTLHEGDDFGKLALVNDAPRAATVALRDHNSQFLRVDKFDFNRILRDVEANTIRLKEHGQDVLVLERMLLPTIANTASQQQLPPPGHPPPPPPPPSSSLLPFDRHQPNRPSTSFVDFGSGVVGHPDAGFYYDANGDGGGGEMQCAYSMMAGTPEKMVEYLLETRIDALTIHAVNLNTEPTTVDGAEALLTRSCCAADFDDLPLRYMDDVDGGGGAVPPAAAWRGSDGNLNYCGGATSSMAGRRGGQNGAAARKDVVQRKQPPLLFVVENLDASLEDFLYTHIIFMAPNQLCNTLKDYYNRRRTRRLTGSGSAAGGAVTTNGGGGGGGGGGRTSSAASGVELPLHYLHNNGKVASLVSAAATAATVSLAEERLAELQEEMAAKRRVVAFLVVWQYILGIHFFLDPVANSFVEELYCCVLEDAQRVPNMFGVVEQIGQLRQLREYAMSLLSRHPTLVLDCGVYSAAQAPAPNPVLPIDYCNQCIYLSDTTFITLDVRLDKSAAQIAEMARAKIRRQRRQQQLGGVRHVTRQDMERDDDNDGDGGSGGGEVPSTAADGGGPLLVEVKSNGERVVYSPTEVGVPTMLSLNGRLYVILPHEIDQLLALPEQDGPTESVHHSVLELLRSGELARRLAAFHTQLFAATNEIELIFQVIGRDQFPGRNSCNLDVLLRRFNELQYWTSTEVLLAGGPAKRFNVLKKFIKIAAHSKQIGDLMTLFAVTLGLSNVAVSRLSHLWTKLPGKLRRQYAEFEALLDPSRNHRAYRLLVAKLDAPIVPFVPLLLKDLTFMHEGNKTSFAGLVNFEKMHMIANVLRAFRNCKTNRYQFGMLTPPPLPPSTSSPFGAAASSAFQPAATANGTSASPTLHAAKQHIQSTMMMMRGGLAAAAATATSSSSSAAAHGLICNFRVIDNQRRLMELSYAIEPPLVQPTLSHHFTANQQTAPNGGMTRFQQQQQQQQVANGAPSPLCPLVTTT